MAIELTKIFKALIILPLNSRTLGLFATNIFNISLFEPGPGCHRANASWAGYIASRSQLRD